MRMLTAVDVPELRGHKNVSVQLFAGNELYA